MYAIIQSNGSIYIVNQYGRQIGYAGPGAAGFVALGKRIGRRVYRIA